MKEEKKWGEVLKLLAPGTPLREGLENILRARTGSLIVISDDPEVAKVIEGGFEINCEFRPAALYELAKMDGAIILSGDVKRILRANTHLVPDAEIPTRETGIRHRVAERVAKQTGATVIAISQRRGIITLYQGNLKYILRDIGFLLTKANQAVQTLEKYQHVAGRSLQNLATLELEGMVTILDVVKAIQKVETVVRIKDEIESYIYQLGTEGRLVEMQLTELARGIEEEENLLLLDYAPPGEKSTSTLLKSLRYCSTEELLDLNYVGRLLGYGGNPVNWEANLVPRGYRLLRKIPRLPFTVVENLVNTFGSLPEVMKASLGELDQVEGIGEVRARAVKEGLARLREQAVLESTL